MTQRLDLYHKSLERAVRSDFKPQIVKENESQFP